MYIEHERGALVLDKRPLAPCSTRRACCLVLCCGRNRNDERSTWPAPSSAWRTRTPRGQKTTLASAWTDDCRKQRTKKALRFEPRRASGDAEARNSRGWMFTHLPLWASGSSASSKSGNRACAAVPMCHVRCALAVLSQAFACPAAALLSLCPDSCALCRVPVADCSRDSRDPGLPTAIILPNWERGRSQV